VDPETISRTLERILPKVRKPGRYTGGELNQVRKDWERASLRVALAFPDIYDLGMSNLALAILYDIINRQPDALAERTFAPWPDMEAAMRKSGIPLFSLENKRPLSDFDLIGFSLPYESLYTNTINMLDLAGIPLRSPERSSGDPIVIAGGHACFNPEPMSEFIDAFAIGEAEELILDVTDAVRLGKQRGASRDELLHNLARIWGVYVPSLYRVDYRPDGVPLRVEPLAGVAKLPVTKRLVPQLPPPVTHPIVPYIETAHQRVPIEIMRGCTRGCRFCHAGMINRPVRERPVEQILEAIETAVDSTGFESIGLLSLSSSDYSHISELVEEVGDRFKERHISISLPSLRIESFSVELMDALQGGTHVGGFTLAPEAATERMRDIINKPVSSALLLETARQVFQHGWHHLKLYFMIGHPSETLDDVAAIADLCKAVLAEGQAIIGRRASVRAGVSTFVPKPHTPFQWVPCERFEQIEAKQDLLKRKLRGPGLKLNWTDPRETMLEAWLSRGDRRMGNVILGALQRGARFDAWREHFNYPAWTAAFAAAGLDPAFYTHRRRSTEELLPWDHINPGVRKDFLIQDYRWSQEGRTRVDCREQCFACGILPGFKDLRREHPGEHWRCPEVRSPRRGDVRIKQGAAP
jgi:radical SAM family uncharacterized protein